MTSEEEKIWVQRKIRVVLLFRRLFLILELAFGLIVFAVEVHNEIGTIFTRYHSYHYLEKNIRWQLFWARVTYTTVVTFPFIILPVLCICVMVPMILRQSNFRVLYIMFGAIACVLYIATGIAVVLTPKQRWINNVAKYAFVVLCLITGLLYLVHVIYEILKDRQIHSKDFLQRIRMKREARWKEEQAQYAKDLRKIQEACKDICY